MGCNGVMIRLGTIRCEWVWSVGGLILTTAWNQFGWQRCGSDEQISVTFLIVMKDIRRSYHHRRTGRRESRALHTTFRHGNGTWNPHAMPHPNNKPPSTLPPHQHSSSSNPLSFKNITVFPLTCSPHSIHEARAWDASIWRYRIRLCRTITAVGAVSGEDCL